MRVVLTKQLQLTQRDTLYVTELLLKQRLVNVNRWSANWLVNQKTKKPAPSSDIFKADYDSNTTVIEVTSGSRTQWWLGTTDFLGKFFQIPQVYKTSK